MTEFIREMEGRHAQPKSDQARKLGSRLVDLAFDIMILPSHLLDGRRQKLLNKLTSKLDTDINAVVKDKGKRGWITAGVETLHYEQSESRSIAINTINLTRMGANPDDPLTDGVSIRYFNNTPLIHGFNGEQTPELSLKQKLDYTRHARHLLDLYQKGFAEFKPDQPLP